MPCQNCHRPLVRDEFGICRLCWNAMRCRCRICRAWLARFPTLVITRPKD